METELKLKVAQPDLVKLRQHALLADMSLASPDELELTDTYYDTPKLDLWRNGLTLRVRASDGTWVQTVKTAASGSPALHQRGEWECALPGPSPDPAALLRQVKPKRIAELLRSPAVATQLRPVFNNTTRRTRWNIVLPDGQRVECVLDAGDLHVGKRNAAIGELELEMKKGDPAQLFELALALHEQIPLQIANDSADLARRVAVAEQRARDLHRERLQTLHQPRYTQVILQLNGWFHGRQWREGLADKSPLYRRVDEAMVPLLRKAQQRLRKRIGALDENDPAARHRVRIAAKKARYAAEFFSDLLPAKPAKRYVRALSALQDKLGHLNDLAVANALLEKLTAPDLLQGTTYARGYVAASTAAESHQLRPALDAVAQLKMTG